MTKVGITGGSGYIGRYNTQKFLNEGANNRISINR